MNSHWKYFALVALLWAAACSSLHAQPVFLPSRGSVSDEPLHRDPVRTAPADGGIPGVGAAPYESDILAARPIKYLLGLGFGAYGFLHRGSFSPSCDCEFSDEDGIRFMFAGEFRVRYPKLGIAYGVFVSYYDASATFTREEVRSSVVVGDNPDVDVQYRSTSDVTLQWLSLTPEFLWYLPRSEFFLSVGAEFGFPLETRYNHIENILTSGYTYYDGSTENVLLEEQDIPGGAGLRVALAGAIGYDFFITPMIGITPRLGLTLPLSSVASSDDGWTVPTAHALLMLNLRL
mgnify:CR=1 FL=1